MPAWGATRLVYDFADGQVPSTFTVEQAYGEATVPPSTLVSVQPSPAGGPGGNSLVLESQPSRWTFIESPWDPAWSYWDVEDDEYHVYFDIPADTWTTLSFWFKSELDPLSLPSVVMDDEEDWGYIGVSAGMTRRRDNFNGTNSTWVNNGLDWWGPDSEFLVNDAGWIQRTINLSPTPTPTRLYLRNFAWGNWAKVRNGVAEPPPSGLDDFSGKAYFADIRITHLASQERFADWRLGGTSEDDDWFPFVWVREWSDWQDGVEVNTGWRPRYSSSISIRANLEEDSGGFAGLPYDESKVSAMWDRVRNNDYDTIRHSEGHWIGNPWGGVSIAPHGVVEAWPSWGYYSALSAIWAYHRATAGMSVFRWDARYHRKWLIVAHTELLASIGVTANVNGGVNNAAPIPTSQRDAANPLEVLHNNGNLRSAAHRQYIQYDYSQDNELLEGTIQRQDGYPTQSWHSNEWPPAVQTALDVAIVSPLVDLSDQVEGTANNTTVSRLTYQSSLPAAWFQVTYPGNDPAPTYDLLSQLTNHGETVGGEPEDTVWLLFFRSVQRNDFIGAFGAVGDRGNRSSGTITDGESHRLFAQYHVRMKVKTRPWRYWIAYETDVPYGLEDEPQPEFIPPLRLFQRDDDPPAPGEALPQPRIPIWATTRQRGQRVGPNTYW
jgi:hypothetical protein